MTATICTRCDQLDDPEREQRCPCRAPRKVPRCTCFRCTPHLYRGDRYAPRPTTTPASPRRAA